MGLSANHIPAYFKISPRFSLKRDLCAWGLPDEDSCVDKHGSETGKSAIKVITSWAEICLHGDLLIDRNGVPLGGS